MGLIQPNETTKAAVGHPVAYALFTAVICGVIAGAGFAASGLWLAAMVLVIGYLWPSGHSHGFVPRLAVAAFIGAVAGCANYVILRRQAENLGRR